MISVVANPIEQTQSSTPKILNIDVQERNARWNTSIVDLLMDNEIVGSCGYKFEPCNNTTKILLGDFPDMLGIKKEHRKKGLGTYLFCATIAAALDVLDNSDTGLGSCVVFEEGECLSARNFLERMIGLDKGDFRISDHYTNYSNYRYESRTEYADEIPVVVTVFVTDKLRTRISEILNSR